MPHRDTSERSFAGFFAEALFSAKYLSPREPEWPITVGVQ